MKNNKRNDDISEQIMPSIFAILHKQQSSFNSSWYEFQHHREKFKSRHFQALLVL